MIRFLFASDPHEGKISSDIDRGQTHWVGGPAHLYRRIARYMEREEIDHLLLGGDLTHSGSDAEIAAFLDSIGPVSREIFAVAGNHDLYMRDPAANPKALDRWQAAIERVNPRLTFGDHLREFDDCTLIQLTNSWRGTEENFVWTDNSPVLGRLTEFQLEQLDRWLRRESMKPAILLHHFPYFTAPSNRRLSVDDVAWLEEHQRQIDDVLQSYPRVRLQLSGHHHFTKHAFVHGRLCLCQSAMAETPFEVKRIEVDRSQIRCTTVSFWEPGDIPIIGERRWVGGTVTDREMTLSAC